MCLVCCGASQSGFKPPPVGDDDLVLGPGDKVKIAIYGEKELPDTYQLAQDGTIEFPFLGVVHMAGLEPAVASRMIASKLREGKYFKDPQISLLVLEYNSKRVTVMGAVAKPTTIPITTGITLIEAITLSGGVTSIANQNETVLSRKVAGKIRRYRIPLNEISRGRASDFALQAGDIVYLPERVF